MDGLGRRNDGVGAVLALFTGKETAQYQPRRWDRADWLDTWCVCDSLYVLALTFTFRKLRWSWTQYIAGGLSSFLPFGTFIFERKIYSIATPKGYLRDRQSIEVSERMEYSRVMFTLLEYDHVLSPIHPICLSYFVNGRRWSRMALVGLE